MFPFSVHSRFSYFSFFSNDLVSLLPEIFLVCCICLFLVHGVVFSKTGRILSTNVANLSILALVFVCILLCCSPGGNYLAAYSCFFEDDFIRIIKVFLLLTCIFCVTLSLFYIQLEKSNTFEYSVLLLISLFGIIAVLGANDFLSLYLGLELQALSFYTLAANVRVSEFATEAGLKYFVIGAVASGFYLFGASLLYGFTGCVRFSDFSLLLSHIAPAEVEGIFLAFFIFFSSFLFKVGAVPFHAWVPDVYEGTSLNVTAIFALLPKLALFGVITRLLFCYFFSLFDVWQFPFVLCAVFSFVWGSLAALGQGRIKRLLAYGGISHSGYLLFGVCSGTVYGAQGVVIYLLSYILSGVTIFCSLVGLRFSRVRYIADFAGLSLFSPGVAFAIAASLLSAAGIPPVVGFFGKLSIFLSALAGSLYVGALFGVLCSVISTFYYLRILRTIFFENGTRPLGAFFSFFGSYFSKELSFLVGFCAVLLFWIPINPRILFFISFYSSIGLIGLSMVVDSVAQLVVRQAHNLEVKGSNPFAIFL